jgi:Uncharacterized conserved protein
MKIAVTTQDGRIFQHFGKCPTFTVYAEENGAITGEKLLDAAGNGHAALSGFLQSEGVDVVICGGIGDGAKAMLSAAGIRLVSGIEGGVREAAEAYLSGSLRDQGGSCAHEDRHEDCSCENHCS